MAVPPTVQNASEFDASTMLFDTESKKSQDNKYYDVKVYVPNTNAEGKRYQKLILKTTPTVAGDTVTLADSEWCTQLGQTIKDAAVTNSKGWFRGKELTTEVVEEFYKDPVVEGTLTLPRPKIIDTEGNELDSLEGVEDAVAIIELDCIRLKRNTIKPNLVCKRIKCSAPKKPTMEELYDDYGDDYEVL